MKDFPRRRLTDHLTSTLAWFADAIAILAVSIIVLALVSGCSHIEPRVTMPEPTTARPVETAPDPVVNGAIFQAQYAQRPLFEDQKPRRVGDILTIAIDEKTSASRSSSSSASKTADAKAAVTGLPGLPGRTFAGAQLGGSSANNFEGKGGTANDNTFTGTITATVIRVLANGNLAIAGEKQIGINQSTETIRFSGIVAPISIQAGNIVQSSQVADARLEYRGKGYIDEAQRMSWLQRFFMTFYPF